LLAWHTIFMIMTMIIVSGGVRNGLEKAVKLLMPSLFVLLLVLVGYAWNSGGFEEGVSFLFQPDFSKITANGILIAMGHAFFTLSLGMGAIMVYGSYLPDDASIAKTSIAVSLMDTLVAMLAGLAIFPIVFANGLEPGAGPGLIFQTLPIAFGHMQYGAFFGMLFFVLLVFAAWSSSISLIEPAVAWLVENRNMSRVFASMVAGMATWLFGLLTVLSFNLWSEVKLLSRFDAFRDSTVFDLLDYLTANIMLPLGGLLIAIFASWKMSRAATVEELGMGEGFSYKLWRFLVRYITPIAVVIVFLKAISVI